MVCNFSPASDLQIFLHLSTVSFYLFGLRFVAYDCVFTVAARTADITNSTPTCVRSLLFDHYFKIKRGGRDFRVACLHLFGSCMKEKEKS